MKPRSTAELAVGDALKAHVFLQADDVADGVVLDVLQLFVLQRSGGLTVLIAFSGRARLEKIRRTEQTADVLRAKWRALGHGSDYIVRVQVRLNAGPHVRAAVGFGFSRTASWPPGHGRNEKRLMPLGR